VVQEPHDVASCELVVRYARLLKLPPVVPKVDGIPLSTALPALDINRPCAVVLSPHPDDESLTGGFACRLSYDHDWQIVNIAVTLGSNEARRVMRKDELSKACSILHFSCVLLEENGGENVNVASRDADPSAWAKKVHRLAEIIEALQPQAIIMPHANDVQPTHVGTHLLGMDALAQMPQTFSTSLILTEYWQPMLEPNVAVGLGEKIVSTLMLAMACHEGEVARNAYDRRFPAMLIDAVRRSERIGGSGKPLPDMDFCQLVCFGSWLRGRFVPSALKRFVGPDESVAALFE